MTISLYDASVASYLQVLPAVAAFLDKAKTYCDENAIALSDVVETRIFPDMLPFRFQIQSVAHHSRGAVNALLDGKFAPPGEQPAHDYAGLQALLADSLESLRKLTPDEINARAGADVVFRMRDAERVFTTEGFILSFSLPNFYFHATTAYDMLRAKGVPLGKRHFTGALRLKG